MISIKNAKKNFISPDELIKLNKYGDRIYIDKVKRSGLSIYRNLTIKQNYGPIKFI